VAGAMNILVVEDDDVDAEMLDRALKKIGVSGTLVRARDGAEAFEVLCEDIIRPQLPRPYVVLLDINMPRMNGHEFLTAIRAEERFRPAWVFVFSTSDDPQDIARAYRNNAAGYIVKPNTSAELIEVMTRLARFWDICLPLPDPA
jgi:CheY-like chemotaxis protein